jgi:two-component system, LytTR family, sensor kinase
MHEMALVHADAGSHARPSDMSRSPLARLRGLAIVCAVWTVVALSSLLSTYLRVATGEIKVGEHWWWVSLAVIPLWTAATLPILALSRRLPLERRTWMLAVPAHLAVLFIVLAADGVINMLVSPTAGGRTLTFWQQTWRYSFIDTFFYAGVVAVEHAARYYRMYLDRRVHASELEAELSAAQLQALQMQIRPHFLFNTLNTISGLVRIDHKASAITMLAGLGDLLRLLLRSDGAQEVPVRQELAVILCYLQIEQVRFGDQLAVELSVEAGVDDALVPNLILQPLVENAVRHGIGIGRGRVAVRVARVADSLRMEVSDSGEAEPSDSGSHGIGLSNTRARLERLYGAAQRFELVQSAAGTSAIIELPFHRASEP